jgi:hypothetical protein
MFSVGRGLIMLVCERERRGNIDAFAGLVLAATHQLLHVHLQLQTLTSITIPT